MAPSCSCLSLTLCPSSIKRKRKKKNKREGKWLETTVFTPQLTAMKREVQLGQDFSPSQAEFGLCWCSHHEAMVCTHPRRGNQQPSAGMGRAVWEHQDSLFISCDTGLARPARGISGSTTRSGIKVLFQLLTDHPEASKQGPVPIREV